MLELYLHVQRIIIIIIVSGYIMYTSYPGQEDQLELHLHMQRIIITVDSPNNGHLGT